MAWLPGHAKKILHWATMRSLCTWLQPELAHVPKWHDLVFPKFLICSHTEFQGTHAFTFTKYTGVGVLWRRKYLLCPEITSLLHQREGRSLCKPKPRIYFFQKGLTGIQVGMAIKRSVIQALAPSRDTRDTRPCYSSLCPGNSWKPPATEPTQPAWWFLPLPACPHGQQIALSIQSDSRFNFQLSCLILPDTDGRIWLHLLHHSPINKGAGHWIFPQAVPPLSFSRYSQAKKHLFCFSCLSACAVRVAHSCVPQMLGGKEVGRVVLTGPPKWATTCTSAAQGCRELGVLAWKQKEAWAGSQALRSSK